MRYYYEVRVGGEIVEWGHRESVQEIPEHAATLERIYFKGDSDAAIHFVIKYE